MKCMLTFVTTRREATQRVMAAKLIRLTHKIPIHLRLMEESFTICAILAQGGQSGNFWIHPRITVTIKKVPLLTEQFPIVNHSG